MMVPTIEFYLHYYFSIRNNHFFLGEGRHEVGVRALDVKIKYFKKFLFFLFFYFFKF